MRPLRGSRASSASVPSRGSPRSEQSTSVSPDSSWTQAVSSRRASAVAIASPEPGTQRIRRNQLAPSTLGMQAHDSQHPGRAEPPVAAGDGLVGDAEDLRDRGERGPAIDAEALRQLSVKVIQREWFPPFTVPMSISG